MLLSALTGQHLDHPTPNDLTLSSSFTRVEFTGLLSRVVKFILSSPLFFNLQKMVPEENLQPTSKPQFVYYKITLKTNKAMKIFQKAHLQSSLLVWSIFSSDKFPTDTSLRDYRYRKGQHSTSSNWRQLKRKMFCTAVPQGVESCTCTSVIPFICTWCVATSTSSQVNPFRHPSEWRETSETFPVVLQTLPNFCGRAAMTALEVGILPAPRSDWSLWPARPGSLNAPA